MSTDLARRFEDAAALIDDADALVIAAGAGIGIDSGLPDFRGDDGFWRAYPALRAARLDFRTIASPAACRDDPARAWGFYGHRLALYRATVPHPGFAILKRWGERMPHGCSVFTSNADGQFQKAGFDQGAIHECHGSIQHLQCMAPCCDEIWDAEGFTPEVDADRCLLLNAAPTCPHCGGLARPNILMFGDGGWLAGRSDRQARRQEIWLSRARRPVVIEIGAGSAIPSVRLFSDEVLQHHNGRLVRINPREAAVPHRLDIALPCGALEALAGIAAMCAPPGNRTAVRR
jgi:NAD-dependent SIR2 family protein deacetylase